MAAKNKPEEGLYVRVKKSLLQRRKIYIGFIILLVIGLVVGLGLFLSPRSNSGPITICAGKPTSIVTKDIGPQLALNQVTTIQPIVDEILAAEDYETDLNCMYILTVYYIKTSDPDKARASFTTFEQLYPEQEPVSVLLGESTWSIEELNQNVGFLEENKRNFEQGGRQADKETQEILLEQAGIENGQ